MTTTDNWDNEKTLIESKKFSMTFVSKDLTWGFGFLINMTKIKPLGKNRILINC